MHWPQAPQGGTVLTHLPGTRSDEFRLSSANTSARARAAKSAALGSASYGRFQTASLWTGIALIMSQHGGSKTSPAIVDKRSAFERQAQSLESSVATRSAASGSGRDPTRNGPRPGRRPCRRPLRMSPLHGGGSPPDVVPAGVARRQRLRRAAGQLLGLELARDADQRSAEPDSARSPHSARTAGGSPERQAIARDASTSGREPEGSTCAGPIESAIHVSPTRIVCSEQTNNGSCGSEAGSGSSHSAIRSRSSPRSPLGAAPLSGIVLSSAKDRGGAIEQLGSIANAASKTSIGPAVHREADELQAVLVSEKLECGKRQRRGHDEVPGLRHRAQDRAQGGQRAGGVQDGR